MSFSMFDMWWNMNRVNSMSMGETEVADLNFIGFNQDAKALAIGHHKGYAVYSLLNVLEAPVLQYENESTPDIRLVERMFNSSLLTLVSLKNPRLMQVYHFMNRSLICEHKFGSSILNVKMNRDRLIVCLEECIHVYNLRDMKQVMHTICDTPPNRTGMIDLSSCGSPSLLAYPGSTSSGQVHMFDAMSLTSVNSFMAHANPLSALRFNAEGTKIATASTKGTVIRVFSVPNGTKLFEFQRGVRPCVMHSLCFSADSNYLCSSSNTETIHVYKLAKAEEQPQAEVASGGGWLEYMQQTASAYLKVGEFLRETDFAVARLPASQKTVAAMITLSGLQHLLVASTDGFVYCFRVPVDGGQCELIKQHRVGGKGARGSPPTEGGTPPTRPPRAGDRGGERSTPPDTSDLDEFPPMSHNSGH
ncbi:atg-18 [Pristionchus pacificus]|uniref:Atg-18 n=1 Tax=Pristionchus pacificus TaxID=54126 RepID=A0A2A6CRZ1_PRIPA|nr:atg-18 [Pristionchus pacificus]|eukprot:PDM80890.1 atg-18 [Pristionchus pacificus]